MERTKPSDHTKTVTEKEPGFFEYLLSIPKQLDRWMFGKASPVTMGILRMTLGFLAFVNLLLISVGFEDWFTERGYVPQELSKAYAGDFWRFNPLMMTYDGRIALAVYILVTISAFLTMIGLWSRVSSIVLAVGMIAIHHRNMIVLHGGDVILRMALIYVACSPSGAACSVDRLIALWKGKAPLIPAAVSMWPQRLLEIQIAILYYTTVWSKWMGFHWKDGTASYYPMHLKEFEKFWTPDFMRENPTILMFSTYGTLIAELSLATIAFYKPWRKYAIFSGIALHLFIEYTMNIPLFAFIMIATYLSFFEGEEMSSWAKRVGQRFKDRRIKLLAPFGREYKEGPKNTLDALDPFDLVELSQSQEGNDWQTEGKTGKSSSLIGALARCFGAWPLALVPGMWRRLLNKATE